MLFGCIGPKCGHCWTCSGGYDCTLPAADPLPVPDQASTLGPLFSRYMTGKAGIPGDSVTYSVLVDTLASCGRWGGAIGIFNAAQRTRALPLVLKPASTPQGMLPGRDSNLNSDQAAAAKRSPATPASNSTSSLDLNSSSGLGLNLGVGAAPPGELLLIDLSELCAEVALRAYLAMLRRHNGRVAEKQVR